MDEFKFVFKCFLFSCLIVIFSQTRIQGETLENKAFVFLQHSETANWIRAAADGGIKLIRQGAEKTQDFVSEKFGGSHGDNADRPVKKNTNTGLFRKIEKEKTQPVGETAESDLNNQETTDN